MSMKRMKRIYIKIVGVGGGLRFLMIDPTDKKALRYDYLYADLVQRRLLPYDVSRIAERVREAIPDGFVFGGPDREIACLYADVDERQPLWARDAEKTPGKVGIRSGSGELVTGPDDLAEFNPELSPETLATEHCTPLDEVVPRVFRKLFGQIEGPPN